MFIVPKEKLVKFGGQPGVRDSDSNNHAETMCNQWFQNDIINISLVEGIRICTITINELARVDGYKIIFRFTHNEISWMFKSESERDETLKRILNIHNGNRIGI